MLPTSTLYIAHALKPDVFPLASEAPHHGDLEQDFIREQPALAALERAQCALRPLAEEAEYLTEEEFFRDFS